MVKQRASYSKWKERRPKKAKTRQKSAKRKRTAPSHFSPGRVIIAAKIMWNRIFWEISHQSIDIGVDWWLMEYLRWKILSFFSYPSLDNFEFHLNFLLIEFLNFDKTWWWIGTPPDDGRRGRFPSFSFPHFNHQFSHFSHTVTDFCLLSKTPRWLMLVFTKIWDVLSIQSENSFWRLLQQT